MFPTSIAVWLNWQYCLYCTIGCHTAVTKKEA